MRPDKNVVSKIEPRGLRLIKFGAISGINSVGPQLGIQILNIAFLARQHLPFAIFIGIRAMVAFSDRTY